MHDSNSMGRGAEGRAPGVLLRLWAGIFHARLDQKLADGADPGHDPALGARAAQLLSPKHRRRLAASVDRLVDMADSGRVPLPRPMPDTTLDQVREARELLEVLADTLRDGQPTAPCGVAMVERLFRDVGSPLHTPSFRGHLTLEVEDALNALRRG